jgi:hypothetical protein
MDIYVDVVTGGRNCLVNSNKHTLQLNADITKFSQNIYLANFSSLSLAYKIISQKAFGPNLLASFQPVAFHRAKLIIGTRSGQKLL